MIHGLPEKLREQRTKLGYSQRELAAKLGVSPSIISGYETGERTPSVEVLLSLSNLYRCSIDYLLGKESPSPSIVLNVDGLSSRQHQLLSALIDELRK